MTIQVSLVLVVLLPLLFTVYHVQGFAAGFQKKPIKAAPTQPSYVVDESTSRLVKHLVDIQECEGIELLAVGKDISTNLRGLFAKESFREGDYICAIPFVSTILLDETFFSQSEPQDEIQLAAYRVENAIRFLQRVVNNPNTSLEAMYRESIPLSGDDNAFSPTPDFWTEEEIKELHVPSIVQDLLERKELVRSRVQCSDNNNDETRVTETELRHALWLVRSRAFTTLKEAIDLDGTEGFLQRTVMVPFLDFLNHQRTPNAALEVVESKAYEESFYALVATRPIRPGDQVTICYGTSDEASWDLYTQYGFWPDGHEANECQQLPEFTEWTTTLEQDLEQRNSLAHDDASVTRGHLGLSDPNKESRKESLDRCIAKSFPFLARHPASQSKKRLIGGLADRMGCWETLLCRDICQLAQSNFYSTTLLPIYVKPRVLIRSDLIFLIFQHFTQVGTKSLYRYDRDFKAVHP